MADFQEQAMGLTGLTIDGSSTAPSRAEFSTFLNDGVIDVTSRWLIVRPQEMDQFARESAETTSNASLDLGGAAVITVVREDGVTSNNWRPCRKIPSSQQYLVTDTESLSFASKINPTYMVGDNGKISVFPAPGADPNAFKAYYVNNSPEETDGTALDHASTGIKYFPSDKVYLVILYASIRSLQAKMSATTITDLSLNPVPPDVPTIVDVTFTDATAGSVAAVSLSYANTAVGGTAPVYSSGSVVGFGSLLKTLANLSVSAVPPDTPSNPTISDPGVDPVTVGSLGTVPYYSEQSLTTQRSFDTFYKDTSSSNPFGTSSDPGSFSISAVPPDVPTIATISYAAASNADASATGVTDSSGLASEMSLIDVSGSAPAYTAPTQTISGVAWATEYPATQVDVSAALTALAASVANAEDEIEDGGKMVANIVLGVAEVLESGTDTDSSSSEMQTAADAINTALDKFRADSDAPALFGDTTQYTTGVGLTLVKSAIDRAKAYIDGDEPSGATDAYGAQAAQDTEMVTSALSIAQTEIQRANVYLAEWNATVQSLVSEANGFASEVQARGTWTSAKAQVWNGYFASASAYAQAAQTYLASAQGYSNEVQTKLAITGTKISEFQARVGDALNTYNRNNAVYQMEFQEAVTKENHDLQVAIANANNRAQEYRQEAQQTTQIDQFNKAQDQALNLENAAKAMEDDVADNNSKVQKYQAELTSYQAEVNTEVQEFSQQLSRYQAELSIVQTTWAKTESDNLQKYQLDIQDKLNEFNEDNVLYQSTIQEAMKNADIAAAEAQKEGDLTLQASIQDYSLELQKYQADVNVYQAEVNKEIQEWQTSTDLALRQHTQSMQDNLNLFNDANVEYQALLQQVITRIQTENNVNIQEAQIELQDKMKDADLTTQVNMQAAISDMQAIVAKNESRISKYTAELQSYQAEVAAAVQEYTQNLQGDGMGYQWLQDQYTRLKAEYDQAFMMAAPNQPAQERR